MIDYETALQRLMEDENLDRGAAVDRLVKAHDAGDPEVSKVSGLTEGLLKDYTKAAVYDVGAGLLRGAVEPFEQLGRVPLAIARPFLPKPLQSIGTDVPLTEQAATSLEKQVPTVPYASGASEVVGSALPFAAGEEALDAIPQLAGRGAVKRGIVGGALGALQTGTAKGTALGAAGGVVIPPVLDAAAGMVTKGLTTLFGRAVPEAVPEFDNLPTPPEAPKPTRDGLVGTQKQLPYIITPPYEPHVDVNLTHENEFDTEYVGTKYAATGEPFYGERTILLNEGRGRTLVNPANPRAEIGGAPSTVDLKNPSLIKVGEDPYKDALSEVYKNSPKIVQGFDKTEAPEDYAQEMLGRWAKKNKFDGLILRGNDPEQDIILDYSKFKQSALPKQAEIPVSAAITPKPEPKPEPKRGVFKSKKQLQRPTPPPLIGPKEPGPPPTPPIAEVGEQEARRAEEDRIAKAEYEKSRPQQAQRILGPRKPVEERELTEEEQIQQSQRLGQFYIDLGDLDLDPYIFANRYRDINADESSVTYAVTRHLKDHPEDSVKIQEWLKESGKYQQERASREAQTRTKRLKAGEKLGPQTIREAPKEKADVVQLRQQIASLEDQLLKASDDADFDKFEKISDVLNELKLQLDTKTGRKMGRNVAGYAKQTPEEVAVTHGFKDEGEMEDAIRRSFLSPLEAMRAKTTRPPIPFVSAEGGVDGMRELKAMEPNLANSIAVMGGRRPKLMGQVASFRVEPYGTEFAKNVAQTWVDQDGYMRMSFNQDYLANSPLGRKLMARWNITDPREYYAQILEHELTHVAQFWLEDRGLGGTFGVPKATEGTAGLDRGEWGQAETQLEAQAEGREDQLRQAFAAHRALQQRVAALPDELKADLFKRDAERTRQLLKQQSRQFLKPRSRVGKTIEGFDPDDMDDFDKASRSTFDMEVDPENVLPIELKELVHEAEHSKIKAGAIFRRPIAVSDSPAHVRFQAKALDIMRESRVAASRFRRHASRIFNDLNIGRKDYDAVWEVAEGLRSENGKLVAKVGAKDPRIMQAAVRIRRNLMDPLWEYVYGMDRRAPEILKKYDLPQSEKQWRRLQAIQGGASLRNQNIAETQAAQDLRGMLHFDESHDLRGEYVDGYLTHQPIANEKVELLNQIHQLQTIPKTSRTAVEMATLQERIKRLQTIEMQRVKQMVGALPNRDMVPKRQYFGPVTASEHPGAAEVLLEKDLPKILGRYINGITRKRAMDQTLFEYRKLNGQVASSVLDFDTQYINNLRGVRGYREDIGLANMVDNFTKHTGKNVHIGDVKHAADVMMKLNNLLKLSLNFVRFPIVLSQHVGLTNMVESPRAVMKGLAAIMTNPKRAFMETMSEGLIDRDDEFLGAVDEITPSNWGRLMRAWTSSTRWADYFRKTITYQGFKRAALEDMTQNRFKPSPNFRGFTKDVPGRSPIATARAYGVAATDTLQFRLQAEGKPQAFVGGAARRLWGQFKQWPINIMGYYMDVLKEGDPKKTARLLATLFMYGGYTLGTGEMARNVMNGWVVKHGDSIPAGLRKWLLSGESGWQTVINQMGLGDGWADNIDILSLKDPIGLPRSIEDLPSWAAGPTFGGIYDFAKEMATGPDAGQATKALLSAISPQLRAGIDAYEEQKQGGVFSPTGRTLAMRNPEAIVIRGLDLSPSVRATRYQYKQELIKAMESGQFDTFSDLMDEAQKKGIVFDKRDMQQIKALVKTEAKRQAILGQSWEQYLE